jgi:anti-sigma factor RsiW
MLKCRDMAELVTPYLDGALPAKVRLAARVHLWLCASCRGYVEQMRRTIALLGAGPPPSPLESENKIIALLQAAQRDS